MNSFISSIASCTLFLVISATAPVHAEDMLKSDLLGTETTNADMKTAAGAKTACVQAAELEQDLSRKEAMLKACEAKE